MVNLFRLEGKKRYLRSGSSWPRCVASPESKINKRFNQKEWSFNKAGEDEKRDWEEGGVVVHCAVHQA